MIGAGSAGLSTAAIAASFGVPVVLVERGRMGGECLNAGCVPSKAVIAAAKRAHEARRGTAFGLGWMEPRVDFERLREHVRGVVAAIAPNDSAARFTGLGVTVIQGEARFTAPRRLEAAGSVIEARSFVVATGSRPALPPIAGLDATPYLTNDTVFDLAQRPDRLVVIGAGPVGVELAQAYRRLGVAVVIVAAGGLLEREDPEMAAVIARALAAEGVETRLNATIERVEGRVGRIAVTLRGEREAEILSGSHLLVATGRQAVTDGLGLDAAGVDVDADGIRVDGGLRTTNRRIYAIGDCAGRGGGGLRFTHVANYHAGIVIRRALFRLPARVDMSAIPRVTYCDPEVASVGLIESEAKRGSFRILRWPLSENDRAQTERSTAGHLKALVTARGKILGCSIAAAHAGELIAPWALAIAKGLKVQDLAGLVFAYPTLSEISKRAAVEFIRPSAQNPWVRRAIRAARWLG